MVLSPKSLLRHPRVISPLAEMTDGSFQKILSDEEVSLEDADRLLFCTGKIYYDLIEAREEKKLKNVGDHEDRATVPTQRRRVAGVNQPVAKRQTDLLGSGRADEHGCMALHQTDFQR